MIQTFLESEVNTIGILIVCNAHISIWNIIDCLLKLLFQLIILSLICIRLNTFNLFIWLILFILIHPLTFLILCICSLIELRIKSNDLVYNILHL